MFPRRGGGPELTPPNFPNKATQQTNTHGTHGQSNKRPDNKAAAAPVSVIDFSFLSIVGAGEILRWQLLFEKKVCVCVAARQSVERDRLYPGNGSQSLQL